jgi:hypothetical protein
MEREVLREKKEGEERCREVADKSNNYCRILKNIK